MYDCSVHHSVAFPYRPTQILLGANLSKRGHHLQVCGADCYLTICVDMSALRADEVYDNWHFHVFSQMEGAVKKRVRLRAQL
jgi:hypothetical protein